MIVVAISHCMWGIKWGSRMPVELSVALMASTIGLKAQDVVSRFPILLIEIIETDNNVVHTIWLHKSMLRFSISAAHIILSILFLPQSDGMTARHYQRKIRCGTNSKTCPFRHSVIRQLQNFSQSVTFPYCIQIGLLSAIYSYILRMVKIKISPDSLETNSKARK